MGWKNIKDYYDIQHIVTVGKDCIHVSSPYLHDIIRVKPDGDVSWGRLGPSENVDLARNYSEMSADSQVLMELYHSEDQFKASLPVFTYSGAEIIEEYCEEYGWPNVTHRGNLMYENVYFEDKSQAVRHAKREAECHVEMSVEQVAEAEKKLHEARKRYADSEAILAKLNSDYPPVVSELDKKLKKQRAKEEGDRFAWMEGYCESRGLFLGNPKDHEEAEQAWLKEKLKKE